MRKLIILAWMVTVLTLRLGADQDVGKDSEYGYAKSTEKTSKQLFEYYGIRDGQISEKTYLTYAMVKGVRKYFSTDKVIAQIEQSSGDKCLGERKIINFTNDRSKDITLAFVLCGLHP